MFLVFFDLFYPISISEAQWPYVKLGAATWFLGIGGSLQKLTKLYGIAHIAIKSGKYANTVIKPEFDGKAAMQTSKESQKKAKKKGILLILGRNQPVNRCFWRFTGTKEK